MEKSIRRTVYEYLEPGDDGNPGEQFVEYAIIILIVLNVVMVILESYPNIDAKYHAYFDHFELFSVTVFSLEYVLRIWSIVERKKYEHAVNGRLRYIRSGEAIVDLLAILPFYLTLLPFDLRFLRGLRLFRLFRVFKLARYVEALSIINKVIFEKKEQLLLSVSFIIIVLIVASSIVYYIEYPYQPEQFSSIPKTMWWGIATLTTVGYGDLTPITGVGRLLGGLMAIMGLGMFALPAGIISSGLTEYLNQKNKNEKCPHCGKAIHLPEEK
ncbi:MAG TPA: ion transporter [Cyclobacteriaceae bacterium]|nr:ion transporter [Cyclobacteriaceae bacterium]